MRQIILTAASPEQDLGVIIGMLILGPILFSFGLLITYNKKIQQKLDKISVQLKYVSIFILVIIISVGLINIVRSNIPKKGTEFTIDTLVIEKQQYRQRKSFSDTYEIICPQLKFEVAKNSYNQLQQGDKIKLRVQKSLNGSLLLRSIYIEKNHKDMIIF